jgi:DHA1 family multidrug resistance protein-like MFS transporter
MVDFLAVLFGIGSALAPSISALIILRFFAGFFSSTPLANAGGTLADIGGPLLRTIALPLFTTCGFVGPTLAPLIGGYLAANEHLGWRWCYWLCVIWNALAFGLVCLFMPETLGPALLKLKAIRLRRMTGWGGWRARVEDEKLKVATVRALGRPFKMLAVEPVVQFFIAYLTGEYTTIRSLPPLHAFLVFLQGCTR